MLALQGKLCEGIYINKFKAINNFKDTFDNYTILSQHEQGHYIRFKYNDLDCTLNFRNRVNTNKNSYIQLTVKDKNEKNQEIIRVDYLNKDNSEDYIKYIKNYVDKNIIDIKYELGLIDYYIVGIKIANNDKLKYIQPDKTLNDDIKTAYIYKTLDLAKHDGETYKRTFTSDGEIIDYKIIPSSNPKYLERR